MSLYTIFYAATKFIDLISLAWVAPRSAARYWLERFISPFCAPFRRIARYICMRWGSPFDFTCWLAMLGLELVSYLLQHLYYFLVGLF